MFDNFTEAQKNQLAEALRAAGPADPAVAAENGKALALALSTPIRKAVFSGDVYSDIFAVERYSPDQTPEYPTDLIRPGTENEYVAYTMPDHGKIPERRVESDRIMVNTYRIANAIDCRRSYLRRANWNVIGRMMEVLEAGITKKLNDDAWHTIIKSAQARNILAYDSDAPAGQFTPRLVSLMKTVMRRNGGGNSTSVNRGKLSRIYVSPEAQDDIRAWGINLIPDAIRAQIFTSPDGSGNLVNVYGVEIRDLDELGVGQEYQTYFTSTLGASLASADTELVIGMDNESNNYSFVMPMTKDVETFEDNTQLRSGMFGIFSDLELGFACLDTRAVLAASF